MKAVHFGAGNIGRGFIGLLLSQSGYEVVFSDVNKALVEELQKRGEYTVKLAGDTGEELHVSGVTAIDGSNLDLVASAIAEADLVTTAVGVNILKFIAPGISRGIERRLANGAGPLHVIACENTIGGSSQLKEHVYGNLDANLHSQVAEKVAFPDAAVDRIVPIQHNEDPLEVTVEPFFEWVVDASAMFPGYAPVQGVHYVDNLIPYIERKLFTVNTGHCTAAYIGSLSGYDTIQQAMSDDTIVSKVKATLSETGAVLVSQYGFDPQSHEQYINKIIDRFRNPYLTDEVTRVGRSPIRKLSPNDRLVKPALQAYASGINPVNLVDVMAAALHFDASDDPESVELQQSIRDLGVGATITKYTSLREDHPLFDLILQSYKQLSK